MSMRPSLSFVFACSLALVLAGCNNRTVPSATLHVSPADTQTSLNNSALATDASTGGVAQPIQLSGQVIVPANMELSTANVKSGKVVGSPLRIESPATGRVVMQGVTYYDGSFALNLPAKEAAQPLLLSVDLVDAANPTKTLTLSTPLTVATGARSVQNLTVSPETTALVSLYRQLSGTNGGTSLARYVASTDVTTTRSFALVAGQNKAIAQASSVKELNTALQSYVARCVKSH